MTTPQTHPPQAHAGVALNVEFIRTGMRFRGWSQERFAKVIGYSGAHVSRVFAGLGGASPKMVAAILAAFDTGQPDTIRYDEIVKVEAHPDDEPWTESEAIE
jgi:transcriptional regulator with XRE-family HTH domain